MTTFQEANLDTMNLQATNKEGEKKDEEKCVCVCVGGGGGVNRTACNVAGYSLDNIAVQ